MLNNLFAPYTPYILFAYGLTFGYILLLALFTVWQLRRLRQNVALLEQSQRKR